MPPRHKGGWSWSDRSALILAECIRRGDSSAMCAREIQARERAEFPDMQITKDTILAAMRSNLVPGMLRRLCPDAEDLIQRFHTPKARPRKEGTCGAEPKSERKPRAPVAPLRKVPGKPVTAEQLLAFRQKSKGPAQ